MLDLFGGQINAKSKGEKAKADDPNADLKTACATTSLRTRFRKFRSEEELDNALSWHWEDGTQYHCLSFGNVDLLTYIRCALRQQPLEYICASAWAWSMDDAKEFGEWVSKGMINRVDFYLGDIYAHKRFDVYNKLAEISQMGGGRVCVFKNHCKLAVGFGKNFDFAIESSANINTNPRTEQTCVNISTDLAMFYKLQFDQIKSVINDFPAWKPYNIKR